MHIGDSAHATSPQLGQGANMALLDALALTVALRDATDLPHAMQRYATMRRWHVRLFQWSSAVFTPFYQSDSRLLPLLRDHLLAPADARAATEPVRGKAGCRNDGCAVARSRIPAVAGHRATQGVKMEFSPANPVVKLCLQGQFLQAWNESTQPFERFMSAWFLAREQTQPAGKLRWLDAALQVALQIHDGSVKSALPALYAAIAQCQEEPR